MLLTRIILARHGVGGSSEAHDSSRLEMAVSLVLALVLYVSRF